MKGKPALRGRGRGSKAQPKRGTSSYNLFQKVAQEDLYMKFGGKEALASNVRDKQQLTKTELPLGSGRFVCCAVSNMWTGAPDTVKEAFQQAADVVNARERQLFAEQQQQQKQRQQQPKKKENRAESQVAVAATHETEERADKDSGDMVMASTTSDSEHEGIISSRPSDTDDGRLVPYTVGDSEDEGMTSSRASDSEGGRLVPYTESDSEDERITSSRPAANGCGPAAHKDDTNAAGRASPPPVASEMAQKKDRHSVEKQRASKSVPLVPRFDLSLFNDGNVNPSAVDDTVRPPASALVGRGRGRGHVKSARNTPDSSSSRPIASPLAEEKSPRPANGQTRRGDDAKDSGEPSARNVGCSPKTPGKIPNASAAESKTTKRKKKYFTADREISDAGKGAGFEAAGAVTLRSKMVAAAGQAPGKKSLTRRAASLDGSSSTPKTSLKRRASVAATRTEAGPRAKASLLDGTSSASKSRNQSRESPASPKTTVRAEKGGLSSTTPRGLAPADQGIAGRVSATPATETPGTPKTPATRLGRNTNGGGSVVGNSRNRGTPDRRGRGGLHENNKTDSGKNTCRDTSSDDTESEEEFRISSDDKSGHSKGGGGGAGVFRVGHPTATGKRLTHKKKVWHAGQRAPSTFFGLVRQKSAKIEVLWEVLHKSSRITKEWLWLNASVDLSGMNRTGYIDGHPLWNIYYERHLTMSASESQVVFLSENKLRDKLEWNEDGQCWMGEPLSWRPKQGQA